ncbi:hypothetical protein ACFVAV_25305 [Nocardia sp. NPDC057663]|uniref:hypothetical protein n=1 Tax=Nocardia sp. NPDC057663 TaxID=3346201 RepID=UPI003672EF20
MSKMNTYAPLGELEDPKLKKIGQRAASVIELAAIRVAAHHADRKKFPLPAEPDSVETTLAAWFDAMPAARKAAAAQQVVQHLASPEFLSSRFGKLSEIDLSASKSISAQASSIPLSNLKFTAAEIAKLTGASVRGGLSPQLELSNRLRLQVSEVHCGNESDPQAGKDDMWLGGTMVDETGDTQKIHRQGNTKKSINLGKFDNKDTKKYSPPVEVAAFNLTGGSAFPKSYIVIIVLCENDDGDLFSETLNDLLAKTEGEAKEWIRRAGAEGGDLGKLGGEIAAWAYGELVDWISTLWGDIIFAPVTLTANIVDYDAVWNDTKRKETRSVMAETKGQRGHARYQFSYTWKLSEKDDGSFQSGWRWCNKCQGLFFGGRPNPKCPTGGAHDKTDSGNYTLTHNLRETKGWQSDWRWCNKCQGLFFGGRPNPKCPAGGAHDKTDSGNYSLWHNAGESSSQQSDWRWCNKCQGLFFGGRPNPKCPAGGAHDKTGSGNYSLYHER